jgi:transcriptional repressor NrdR
LRVENEFPMHCPYCGRKETEVVETRDNEDLDTIRRRRACLHCLKRFTTYERVENVHLAVIKKDGKREQFHRDKLKMGLVKSCEKTTVSIEQIEKIVIDVERELRSGESIEINSMKIGELVAEKLKKLDKVAYIRFASVFKQFVDIEDFEEEVKGLIHNDKVLISND